jgi:hypothetical protein
VKHLFDRGELETHNRRQEIKRHSVHVGEGNFIISNIDEAQRSPNFSNEVDRNSSVKGDLRQSKSPLARDKDPLDGKEIQGVLLECRIDLGV